MCACPCAKGKVPPGQAACQSQGGGCGAPRRSSTADPAPAPGPATAPPPTKKRQPCGPKPCGGGQCGKCGPKPKEGTGGKDDTPSRSNDPGDKGGTGGGAGGGFGGLSAPPNNRGPVALGLAALLFATGIFLTTKMALVASEIG